MKFKFPGIVHISFLLFIEHTFNTIEKISDKTELLQCQRVEPGKTVRKIHLTMVMVNTLH